MWYMLRTLWTYCIPVWTLYVRFIYPYHGYGTPISTVYSYWWWKDKNKIFSKVPPIDQNLIWSIRNYTILFNISMWNSNYVFDTSMGNGTDQFDIRIGGGTNLSNISIGNG